MTDSNIQPPNTGAGLPDSVVPGTDVTYTTPAGLYPETTDPNQDVVITTGTAEDTYTVDPYASAVDFQVYNIFYLYVLFYSKILLFFHYYDYFFIVLFVLTDFFSAKMLSN